jgi:hypothetical protein
VGLLVDETMDIFSVEQFSIDVTYIYKDKIRDDFLQLDPLTNVRDQGLPETLIECIKKYSLKIK